MTKTRIMPLSFLILFVFTTSASAKVKMIDIVHLTDGNMVTGEIIETIPKETIKIKTTDGKLITYSIGSNRENDSGRS